MVQTKGKLNNTELFLKLLHIQSKESGNNKYHEETTELEKWQSEISSVNIEVRKEMEDSRLHATECLKTDYVPILAARVQQQLMLILRNLF